MSINCIRTYLNLSDQSFSNVLAIAKLHLCRAATPIPKRKTGDDISRGVVLSPVMRPLELSVPFRCERMTMTGQWKSHFSTKSGLLGPESTLLDTQTCTFLAPLSMRASREGSFFLTLSFLVMSGNKLYLPLSFVVKACLRSGIQAYWATLKRQTSASRPSTGRLKNSMTSVSFAGMFLQTLG